ncbi:hypothetical protein KHP62_15765 [Rhodobacteraceae bacterium NNCM2]|nr:hypothetical protein [Coraliihabitans acroporae]
MNLSKPIADTGTAPLDSAPVARRKVFYISGFDPLGPRRYRELHRNEGRLQAEISGYLFDLEGQPKSPSGAYRWKTRLAEAGQSCEAEFEFLGWDDIVRHSIRPSLLYVYSLMFRTFWAYLSSGAISAMLKLRSGPLIAGLVPAAVMVFYLVYAVMVGIAAALLVTKGIGLPIWAGAIAGLAAATLIMLGTRYVEEQMMVYFMVNDLGYTAVEGGRYPAPVDARLDEFADAILTALNDPGFDEVVVVGHSSGAQLAVSALARAMARARTDQQVSLLTLGQSIAMLSFLTDAAELRADLAKVADDRRVFWLDVTAMGDGACFALTDPVASCRARGRVGESPVVISAAFSKTMEPGEIRRYRWRFMRLHFQYLCAFRRPADFDYFRITGGSQTLRQRFATRASSPSMLAEPVAPICHPG